MLIADELASNALRHGGAPVAAALSRLEDRWLVAVSDSSADVPPTPAQGRDPGKGGFGLYLVADLSAAHGWTTGARQKTAWAVVDGRRLSRCSAAARPAVTDAGNLPSHVARRRDGHGHRRVRRQRRPARHLRARSSRPTRPPARSSASSRCTTPRPSRQTVEQAREAAASWAALGFDGRRQRLDAYRGYLARRLHELADLVHRENGKPHADAILEISLAIDHLAWAAAHARKTLGPRRVRAGLLAANHAAYLEYQPLGVVGVIGPWNYPVFTPMGSIAYALAAGNAVVFKPSEYTPAIGAWLAAAWRAAVPDAADAFQVVTGSGDTGAALCRAGVGKIAFTGSAPTGKKVMADLRRDAHPGAHGARRQGRDDRRRRRRRGRRRRRRRLGRDEQRRADLHRDRAGVRHRGRLRPVRRRGHRPGALAAPGVRRRGHLRPDDHALADRRRPPARRRTPPPPAPA